MTALALDELNVATTLAHLRFLEETDAALPAAGHEPKVTIVGEEFHFAYLAIHDHSILCLVKHKCS